MQQQWQPQWRQIATPAQSPTPPIASATQQRPAKNVSRTPPPEPCDSCAAAQALADSNPEFAQALNDATRAINSPNIPPPDQWNQPARPESLPSQSRQAPDVAGIHPDAGVDADRQASTPDDSNADAADSETSTADAPLDEDERNDCQKAIDDWMPKYVKALQRFWRKASKGYGPFRSFLEAEKYASKTGKQAGNFARRCWKYAQDQLDEAAKHALDGPDQ